MRLYRDKRIALKGEERGRAEVRAPHMIREKWSLPRHFSFLGSRNTVSDQVIREDPAGAVVVRAWPGHRNIGRGAYRK